MGKGLVTLGVVWVFFALIFGIVLLLSAPTPAEVSLRSSSDRVTRTTRQAPVVRNKAPKKAASTATAMLKTPTQAQATVTVN